MKVYAYLRVSTKGQIGEDKFGLAEQQETIEAYCREQNFKIIKTYTDNGISGAVLERPALMELLKKSNKEEVSAVIVAKMDRLARDLMAQLWIEKELLKHNIELISVSEQFRGNDPSNVLFRQIIGAFAQFEKSRITERLAGGRKQKAKTGGYAGGRAALGYKSKLGNKTLEVDFKEAATVKRAFELRDKGLSYRKIAEILNSEGHTTKEDKSFYAITVKRIIDREEFYKGNYQYAGIQTKGQHKSILQEG